MEPADQLTDVQLKAIRYVLGDMRGDELVACQRALAEPGENEFLAEVEVLERGLACGDLACSGPVMSAAALADCTAAASQQHGVIVAGARPVMAALTRTEMPVPPAGTGFSLAKKPTAK